MAVCLWLHWLLLSLHLIPALHSHPPVSLLPCGTLPLLHLSYSDRATPPAVDAVTFWACTQTTSSYGSESYPKTYVRTHMLHPHILILSQTYSRMILQIGTKTLLFAVNLQLPKCYCTNANCLMKHTWPRMHDTPYEWCVDTWDHYSALVVCSSFPLKEIGKPTESTYCLYVCTYVRLLFQVVSTWWYCQCF